MKAIILSVLAVEVTAALIIIALNKVRATPRTYAYLALAILLCIVGILIGFEFAPEDFLNTFFDLKLF